MVRVFGIRHHGPGSARSVRAALAAMQPDIVLVEGPPDADEALPLLAHPEMQPPVALLIYASEQPSQAVFYPFASFSPEYQALLYAVEHAIPARFIDLPQTHQLVDLPNAPLTSSLPHPAPPAPDPFLLLAQAAGYDDGERWWEHLIEQQCHSEAIFDAILEMMNALRQEMGGANPPWDSQLAYREAAMRQGIRRAERDGFARIAVVCGAWHAPALASLPPAKYDTVLLKGLPKTPVSVTWTPWTHGRLTSASGYGAGIASPGWYKHLWTHRSSTQRPEADERAILIHWLAQTAHLLRAQGLDISTANVIETVRLAETIATLRERPIPDLADINEAVRSVLCGGDDLPLRLIHRQLVVGEQMGAVPASASATPLQQDVQREQRRLRLAPAALERILALDLRKATDLERSHLLHRLNLLGVPWGSLHQSRGKGTFREAWRLAWQPEFAVRVVEAGLWGNTLAAAATAAVCGRALGQNSAGEATTPPTLVELTHLLDAALLAGLPAAVGPTLATLQARAALAGDVTHLIDALPPLVNVARYGNVRQTDASSVLAMVGGFVVRIGVGLPVACTVLNDEGARTLAPRLTQAHLAILLLRHDEWTQSWLATLQQLADQHGLHGLLAGSCCRLLFDQRVFDGQECARRLGLALSTANDPASAAAWVEGLLQGSGLLLLHDEQLLGVVDAWVGGIGGEPFAQVLPLLRRTFANFPAAERRQIGERVKRGQATNALAVVGEEEVFDTARAERVLPLLAHLLGLKAEGMA
jgi:hypothetical protein